MSTLPPPTLFNPSTHTHLIPSLVTLHSTCIVSPPHTIATFLPPLSTPVMEKWWKERVGEVINGTRQIIIQLASNFDSGSESGSGGEVGEEVVGVVMLGLPYAETGPWRASVEKLLVSPKYRKRGIATALMGELERVARSEGRGLLLLDTEKGSPAEVIYPRLGYVKCGEIPGYEISPLDGAWKDGIIFYKDMREKASASTVSV